MTPPSPDLLNARTALLLPVAEEISRMAGGGGEGLEVALRRHLAGLERPEFDAEGKGGSGAPGLRVRLSGTAADGSEMMPGLEVADFYPLLHLQGGPGAGKSTLLRQIAWGSESRIPVLADVRLMKRTGLRLGAFLVRTLEAAGWPGAEEFLTAGLAAGRMVVGLDGLGEIGVPGTGDLARDLREMLAVAPGGRFVIAGGATAPGLGKAQVVTAALQPWNDAEVCRAARFWLGGAGGNFVRDWSALAPGHPSRKLAGRPLLLRGICAAYVRGGGFPGSSGQMMRQGAAELLRAAMGGMQDFPLERMEMLLAEMAVRCQSGGLAFLQEAEWAQIVGEALGREIQPPAAPEAGRIVAGLRASGLLRPGGFNCLSLAHPYLQTYGCAAYFHQQGSMAALVRSYAGQPEWTDVLPLAAGLTRADELLRALAEKARGCLPASLALFRQWSGQAAAGPAPVTPEEAIFRRVATQMLGMAALPVFDPEGAAPEEMFEAGRGVLERFPDLAAGAVAAVDSVREKVPALVKDLKYFQGRVSDLARMSAGANQDLLSRLEIDAWSIGDRLGEILQVLSWSGAMERNWPSLLQRGSDLYRGTDFATRPVVEAEAFRQNLLGLLADALGGRPPKLGRAEGLALAQHFRLVTLALRCRSAALSLNRDLWPQLAGQLLA